MTFTTSILIPCLFTISYFSLIRLLLCLYHCLQHLQSFFFKLKWLTVAYFRNKIGSDRWNVIKMFKFNQEQEIVLEAITTNVLRGCGTCLLRYFKTMSMA